MPKVQQRPSGRYFVRLRVDDRQTTVSFDTEFEAERFARDVDEYGGDEAFDRYLMDEDAKAALEAEPTLSQWAAKFFAMSTVSPGTLDNYERDWKNRWEPHLGHLKLSRIERADIVKALKKQTGAPKTVANAWGSLTTILKGAVAADLISRSPHTGIKLPTPEYGDDEDREHRYLDADELLQVIKDTPEQYRPLVVMLIGTGMRWSEATALKVGDVDLTAKTVRVTKAWKRDRKEKRWYVGPPKTKMSKRTITLPNEVVEAVTPLVEGRPRTALLFTNKNGEWVKHQTFYREHWTGPCTKNIADPRPRIHDLRHSHVALLIAAGVGLPVIKARLGHEKITTTIDTYGHLLPDLQVAAADAASGVFAGMKAIDQ